MAWSALPIVVAAAPSIVGGLALLWTNFYGWSDPGLLPRAAQWTAAAYLDFPLVLVGLMVVGGVWAMALELIMVAEVNAFPVKRAFVTSALGAVLLLTLGGTILFSASLLAI